MRIYIDCMEMIREVERDLFEMGIGVKSETVQDRKLEGKEAETLELNGYVFKLTALDKVDEMLAYMKINKDWVQAEFYERMQADLKNPGNAWKVKPDLWGKYLHDDQFEYSYNERIREQLPYLIHEFKHRPNTRQGMITIYDQHKDMRNWGGKARVPCSISYQFLIRNGAMHCIYTMRSCDFLKHFASDITLAGYMTKYIASEVGVYTGTITMLIGSLHAFKTELDARGIY